MDDHEKQLWAGVGATMDENPPSLPNEDDHRNEDIAITPTLQPMLVFQEAPNAPSAQPAFSDTCHLNGVPPGTTVPTITNEHDVEDDTERQIAVTESPSTEHCYTAEELAIIREVDVHLSTIVKTGKIYESARDLRDLVNDYGDAKGFRVAIESSSIRCCLSAKPMARVIRQEKKKGTNPGGITRNRSSPRCGCKFLIKFTSAVKQTGVKGTIRVTSVNLHHSNGCCPNKNTLVIPNRKASISHRQKMDIFAELAELYNGRPDEFEFYGALLARTRALKGASSTTMTHEELLQNHLGGFTSTV